MAPQFVTFFSLWYKILYLITNNNYIIEKNKIRSFYVFTLCISERSLKKYLEVHSVFRMSFYHSSIAISFVRFCRMNFSSLLINLSYKIKRSEELSALHTFMNAQINKTFWMRFVLSLFNHSRLFLSYYQWIGQFLTAYNLRSYCRTGITYNNKTHDVSFFYPCCSPNINSLYESFISQANFYYFNKYIKIIKWFLHILYIFRKYIFCEIVYLKSKIVYNKCCNCPGKNVIKGLFQ